MSFYTDKMIETLARLRFLCEAYTARTGTVIEPGDVCLADLHLAEQERLRFLAEADFRDMVNDRTPKMGARVLCAPS